MDIVPEAPRETTSATVSFSDRVKSLVDSGVVTVKPASDGGQAQAKPEVKPTETKPAEKAEPKAEPTPTEIEAKAQAEKVAATNKEIEDAKRKELLEQSIPDYLKEKGDAPAGTKPESVTDKNNADVEALKKEIQDLKQKNDSYENDEWLKTIYEWRKNGGTDFSEFVRQNGMVDVSKMGIEDMLMEEGKVHGLTDEELTEYVEEEKGKYETLNKVEKLKHEKQLRAEIGKVIAERAKNSTTAASKQNNEFSQFLQGERTREYEKLKTVTDNLAEYKGFPIDEKLRKEIYDNLPESYCTIYNEKGQFVGLDAEKGVHKYMEENYRKQLDKTLYTNGFTSGYDAAMQERTRISPNSSTTAISQKIGDPLKEARERFEKERKGVKN